MIEQDPAGQHPSTRIAQRYGGGSALGRNTVLGAGALIVAALIGWFVWALWLHSHPKVASSMDSWELHGENTVAIVVDVHIYDATAHPVCTVLAYADDHSTVGEHSFRPIAGRQSVTIRTERAPTSVDWRGCTAAGQKDPQ